MDLLDRKLDTAMQDLRELRVKILAKVKSKLDRGEKRCCDTIEEFRKNRGGSLKQRLEQFKASIDVLSHYRILFDQMYLELEHSKGLEPTDGSTFIDKGLLTPPSEPLESPSCPNLKKLPNKDIPKAPTPRDQPIEQPTNELEAKRSEKVVLINGQAKVTDDISIRGPMPRPSRIIRHLEDMITEAEAEQSYQVVRATSRANSEMDDLQSVSVNMSNTGNESTAELQPEPEPSPQDIAEAVGLLKSDLPQFKLYPGFFGRTIISHVNDPQNFYIKHHPSKAFEFDITFHQAQTAAAKKANYKPLTMADVEIGMLCASRFVDDYYWYRVKVFQIIDEQRVNVYYVDWGNTSIVPVDFLMPMLPQFFDKVAHCVKCSLYAYHPTLFSKEHVTKLLKTLKDKDIYAQFDQGQCFKQASEIEDQLVYEVELYRDKKREHNLQAEIHQSFSMIK